MALFSLNTAVFILVFTIFMTACLPALAAALAFRGGLLMHSLGLAVVTNQGDPSSRSRLFWRALIAWSPILLIVGLIVVNGIGAGKASIRTLIMGGSALPLNWVSGILFCVFILGAVWAVKRPQRSLQDRLAGTWLVPK